MKCYTHNDVEATGACVECGKGLCPECIVNVNGKVVCKDCAGKLAGQAAACAPARKDPFIAAVLSLIAGLLTGSLLFSLGQLYNGQVKKFIALTLVNLFMGVIVIGLYIAGSVATLGVGLICCLPVFLLPLIIYIYEIYDAYVTAGKINCGEPVGDWF